MNNLVRLTTQDVSKAIPITDTKIISEQLGVSHRYIKKHVYKHETYFKQFGLLVACATESTGGRPEEIIELNEQQATFLITLLKNTDEVVSFKFKLVKAFFFMRNELQARQQTRIASKYARKSLTDTIKTNVVNDGNFKTFAYSTYSKLVYKKVLGMTVKKYKEINELKESDNIRDYMNIQQLEKVQELESKIATYIEMRTDLTHDDKQVYAEIKKVIE